MKRFIVTLALTLCAASFCWQAKAQEKAAAKIYNESINPMAQISEAVKIASSNGKHVICQVGGNWCRWCLMFADYISKDSGIDSFIKKNYVYIHVNYPRKDAPADLKNRLGNPGRFGFPVFVVLDGKGKIIHIQDSSYLESGEGYDREKVMRFFENWTPAAL